MLRVTVSGGLINGTHRRAGQDARVLRRRGSRRLESQGMHGLIATSPRAAKLACRVP
jgi:hypothetical protein